MTTGLAVARSGVVETFTLDRPAAGNSLSPDLVDALHDALDAFEQAGSRLLILQGEGRNFCTGFDLGDAAQASDGELLLRFVRIELLLARLWRAPYATVAVGKGRVFGAGADLFVACERRLTIDAATFRFPGAAFGLVLGTRRLAERVGRDVGLELVGGGMVVDVETASRVGLATDRITADGLSSTLDALIDGAARLDVTTAAAIRAASRGADAGLDTDMAMLVRSASRPGLGRRLAAFRAQSLAAHRAEAGGVARAAASDLAGATFPVRRPHHLSLHLAGE